jgi:hypothetical protein
VKRLELLQGSSGAAQKVVKAHQLAMGCLAQRVGGGETLGVVQGFLMVTPTLVQRNQPLQCVQIEFPQLFPLHQRPVVVVVTHEIGAVQGGGVLQSADAITADVGTPDCRSHYLLKLLHVKLISGMESEGDSALLGYDAVASRPQGASDLPECVGKGAPSPLSGSLRREDTGQPLAGDGPFVIEDQIGQQRLGCGGGRGRQACVDPGLALVGSRVVRLGRMISSHQFEWAEELYVPVRHAHRSLSLRVCSMCIDPR